MNDVTAKIDYGTASLETKKKWIEALESGEYEQVDGTLKGQMPDGSVGFCCLGVYCDLIGKDMPDEGYEENGCGDLYEGPTEYYNMTIEHLGDFQDEGIEMNDGGSSFIDIAEAAREFYEIPKEPLKKGLNK